MQRMLILVLALLCVSGTARAWPWDHKQPATNVTCNGPDGKPVMKVTSDYPMAVNCSQRNERRTVVATVQKTGTSTLAKREAQASDIMHASGNRATRGKPYFAFCPDGAAPDELARRVEESYAADHSGHRKLRGCHANIVQFMAAFRKGDGAARFTDETSFVAYLRNDLELTTVPPDTLFYSSCLLGRSNGPEDVKMECEKEYIPKGSPVYANKHTHEAIMIKKCANPGLSPVKRAPCDWIVFEVRANEPESHDPVYGPGESAECHGYDWVEFKGDTIRVVAPGGDLQPGCLERNPACSYRGADAAAAPRRRTFDGTAAGLHPGYVAFKVAHGFSTNPGNAFGVCVKRIDPTTGRWTTSQTAIVRDIDYRTLANGQRVALIFYSESDMRKAGHVENDPGGLFLWRGE